MRRESQSNMMFRLFCVLLLLQNTFCIPARCPPYPTLYGIYMYLLRLICGWAHISLSHVSWVAQIVRHLNYCLGEATQCRAWEDGGEWCAPLMLIEFAPQRVQQAPPMEPNFSLHQVKQIKSNSHCSCWVSSFKSNCNLGSTNWNYISIIVLWVRVTYPFICRRHVTRIPEISVLQVSPAQLQVNCELILPGQQTLKEQRLWFHSANPFPSLGLFALPLGCFAFRSFCSLVVLSLGRFAFRSFCFEVVLFLVGFLMLVALSFHRLITLSLI